MKNKLLTSGILLFLFFFLTKSQAQTTYKSDPGFFSPIVESLYLQGGSIGENTVLVGPALGYRFNKNYDLTLHTEYLSTEFNANNKFSMLNFGLMFGRTDHFSDHNMLRSELSVYKSVTLNITGLPPSVPDPNLTTAKLTSSFYRSITLSDSVTLLPNAGGFLGYGDYQPAVSSATLRQGYDGFILGPRLGFDILFQFSNSFYLVVKPDYQLRIDPSQDTSEGTLLFNIQLNF
ncbi:hypothetical protein [Fodinibius halophilus]|uniref:Outer membrane beta-barrel protein n=1 Tax=Fodinibius halophilus TaxID=1736908 RepID=A0A6M1TI46_9BACT|nr:hypothetical protein [Fodinibius halophilus]NGP88290.1 hypothetical protein [Fodinibius halophilus]